MNGMRKRFSVRWAFVGSFVLLMLWATPTHPTLGFVWAAAAICLAALFINSGADERGRPYREDVLGFGVGTAVLTFYFALDGRTDITAVGALMTVVAVAISRLPNLPTRSEDTPAPPAQNAV